MARLQPRIVNIFEFKYYVSKEDERPRAEMVSKIFARYPEAHPVPLSFQHLPLRRTWQHFKFELLLRALVDVQIITETERVYIAQLCLQLVVKFLYGFAFAAFMRLFIIDFRNICLLLLILYPTSLVLYIFAYHYHSFRTSKSETEMPVSILIAYFYSGLLAEIGCWPLLGVPPLIFASILLTSVFLDTYDRRLYLVANVCAVLLTNATYMLIMCTFFDSNFPLLLAEFLFWFVNTFALIQVVVFNLRTFLQCQHCEASITVFAGLFILFHAKTVQMLFGSASISLLSAFAMEAWMLWNRPCFTCQFHELKFWREPEPEPEAQVNAANPDFWF